MNAITKARLKKLLMIWGPILYALFGHQLAEWCEKHGVSWDAVEGAFAATAISTGLGASFIGGSDAQGVADKMSAIATFAKENAISNPGLVDTAIEAAKNGTLETRVPEALGASKK